MAEVLSTTYPVARKEHNCMACDWLTADNWWRYDLNMTFAEYRAIIRAKRNKWKIIKGQKYINATLKQDGELHTFKAIPEIHEICHKYDIYWE